MERGGTRARRRRRWRQRAERASDAFGLVLLLVLLAYAITSLVSNRGWGAVAITIATSVTSIAALTSSQAPPRLVRVAIQLSLATVLLAAIAAASGAHGFLDLASVVQITLLAVAMAAVLGRIVRTAGVNPGTILGALSVYISLGLLFTYAYGTIDRIQSGPFFEGVASPGGGDFLFFSYTTLTTTGYGNLVPGGEPGRMVAGLEMMLGEIFLVTLVAGLVSLWRPGERLRRRAADQEK